MSYTEAGLLFLILAYQIWTWKELADINKKLNRAIKR